MSKSCVTKNDLAASLKLLKIIDLKLEKYQVGKLIYEWFHAKNRIKPSFSGSRSKVMKQWIESVVAYMSSSIFKNKILRVVKKIKML